MQSLPRNPKNQKAFKDLGFRELVDLAKSSNGEAMSAKNINKILGFVSSFWSYAFGHYDDVPKSPFVGMKLRVESAESEERMPFDEKQLSAIFNAPLYKGCQSAEAWLTTGAFSMRDTSLFWIPLIGLFTGARSSEIIQLDVTDVELKGDITFFSIAKEGADKRAKTRESRREIPIHRELLRIGFLEFLEKRKTSGEKRLFPDMPMAADGNYSTSYSPRFKRFLESVDVKDELNSFHSFRHSFEDAALSSGIPQEFIDAIQGHKTPGSAKRYGTGLVRIKKLNEEMQKLEHEDMDLSHLMLARSA